MRGIAAAHAQQSRALLPGVRAYSAVVARAVGQALKLQDADAWRGGGPGGPGGIARIVFCAEQGFVGGFVEHVLADAAARRPAELFLLGSRGALLATSHGLVPVWQSPMATQPTGIATTCLRLAEALYQHLATARPTEVEVVYPSWSSIRGVVTVRQSLLPLDAARFKPAAAGMPPLTTLPPDELLASLADEYVFATLCEAA